LIWRNPEVLVKIQHQQTAENVHVLRGNPLLENDLRGLIKDESPDGIGSAFSFIAPRSKLLTPWQQERQASI
jgi:hypothetical protein